MKYLILFILVILCSSLSQKKTGVLGEWHLEFVAINDTLIFNRDDYSVSLKYNYSLNNPKTKEDSLDVQKMAATKFENSKSLKLRFETDSTFITTKIRSGGRIDPSINENGHYFSSNDSLYLTVPTRNNYKFLLNYNKKNDILFIENILDSRKTYIQYCRIQKSPQ